jgi:hypothetical protein
LVWFNFFLLSILDITYYGPHDFCLLNWLSRDIHHFPLSLWGGSIRILPNKFENEQNINPTHAAEWYCFEQCRTSFIISILESGPSAVCPVQWTSDYSIAWSNSLRQIRIFRGFRLGAFDLSSKMHAFFFLIVLLRIFPSPAFHCLRDYCQFVIPIYTIFSRSDWACQYRLAVSMKLLLSFSVKTDHANAVSEIYSIPDKKSALFRWISLPKGWIWWFSLPRDSYWIIIKWRFSEINSILETMSVTLHSVLRLGIDK